MNNLSQKSYLLPPLSTSLKTLVLDLDETLVHSQFAPFSIPSDVVIKIDIDNEIHDIHVLIRPGVKNLLEKMEKFYEIVIFTASVSSYADPLLNIIDKKNICFFRLFREHCTIINTSFVKDLQRLGRELKNVVIVDNSPLSYIFHPNNGLPIQTWFEDKNDKELYKIIPILEFLSDVDDVRKVIPKIVEKNQINYEKAFEIIRSYKGRKISIDMKMYSKENRKNNIENININNNKNKGNNNVILLQDKLIKLAKKNIIASVSNNIINNESKVENKNNSKIKNSSTNSKNNQSTNIKNNSITKNNKTKSNNNKKLQIKSKHICNSAIINNRFHHTNNLKSFHTKNTHIIKHTSNTPKTPQSTNIFISNYNKNRSKNSFDKIASSLAKNNFNKNSNNTKNHILLSVNNGKNKNVFKCSNSFNGSNTNSNVYHKKQKSYNFFVSYTNIIKKIPNNQMFTPKNITKNNLPMTNAHVPNKYIRNNINYNSANFDYFKTNRAKFNYKLPENRYKNNKSLDNDKNVFKNNYLFSRSTIIEMNKTNKISKFEQSEIVHKRKINVIKNERSPVKRIISKKRNVDKVTRSTRNKSKM